MRLALILLLAGAAVAQPIWLYPSGEWNPAIPAVSVPPPAPNLALMQSDLVGHVTLELALFWSPATGAPPPASGQITDLFLALWVDPAAPIFARISWLDGWGVDGAVIGGIRPFIGPAALAGLTLHAQGLVVYGGSAWLTEACELDVW